MRRISGRVPRAGERPAAGSLLGLGNNGLGKLLGHPIRRGAEGPAEQPRVNLLIKNLNIACEDLSICVSCGSVHVSIHRVNLAHQATVT